MSFEVKIPSSRLMLIFQFLKEKDDRYEGDRVRSRLRDGCHAFHVHPVYVAPVMLQAKMAPWACNCACKLTDRVGGRCASRATLSAVAFLCLTVDGIRQIEILPVEEADDA